MRFRQLWRGWLWYGVCVFDFCCGRGWLRSRRGRKPAYAGKVFGYVIVPVMDCEDELEVPIPDHVCSGIRTKADFVRAIVEHLKEIAPEHADPAKIASIYDRSVRRQELPLPESETSLLYDVTDV